jgi:Holliday junction resolvase RusA-like endonuclease
MEYTFKVPFLPPSINALYGYNYARRQRYLTEQGRHYKNALKIACPPMKFSGEHPFIDIFVEYHSPKWICKNKKVRKADGMNLDKCIYDAISERIGVDDAFFFIWGGKKIISDQEFTKITIKEIDENEILPAL